jgi:L-fucose mutarotase
VIRANGLSIPELLEAMLPLFPLDPDVEASLIIMEAVAEDSLDPKVEDSYRKAIAKRGADASVK